MAKEQKDFKEMFDEAENFDEEWRCAAENDEHFYAGNQWTDADIAKLKREKRPVLVVNRIKSQVDAVSGQQRQNRFDIKLVAEDRKDEFLVAQVKAMNEEISDIMSDEGGLGHHALSLGFKSGVITGRGWYELYIDDDSDISNPRIVLDKLNALHVLFDPTLTKYDINKGEYIIKSVMSSKDNLKMRFPEFAKDIEKMSASARVTLHDDDRERHRFDEAHLAEVWHKEVVKERILIDPILNNIVELEGSRDREETIRSYLEENLALISEAAGIKFVDEQFVADVTRQLVVKDRNRFQIRSAIMINDELMDDRVPYPKLTTFPIVGYFPYWNEEAKDNKDRYQGIVRQLRDLNRELNNFRSKRMHIVNTSANSGWKVDSRSMSKNEIQKLKNFGSKPGLIALFDSQKGLPPQEINPKSDALGQAFNEEKIADDMFKVSGINPESLVQGDSNDSGRALALKIQQANIMLQEPFDNFKRTTRLVGEVMVGLIEEKNDIDIPNMKVVVTESPHNATIQLLRQQELDDFVTKFPGIVPPQVVIEQSTLDEDVKEKILNFIDQAQAQSVPPQAQTA